MYDFDYFKKSADYIKEKIGDFAPQTGLILGSGLSGLGDLLEDRIEIPYADIPNFLVSTAPGHKGRLLFGTLEGRRLVCMSGRFHSYEGYSFEQLAIPARVLGLLGIEQLIATNAAGGINLDYRVGDIMIIKDHIVMGGACSPMRGPNVPEFGPRFFDMTDAYSKELRVLARQAAEETSVRWHEGVYFFFAGPQFETPAEIRAARILGGDASGMSTVTECMTAAHMGLPFMGISLITNMAAGVLDQPLSGEEVNIAADRASGDMQRFMRRFIRLLAKPEA